MRPNSTFYSLPLAGGFLLSLLMGLACLSLSAQSAELIVDVYDIRNEQGTIRAWIFTGEKGFPDKPEHAYKATTGKSHNGKVRLKFSGLSPGTTYGVSVMHDENDNHDMDKNWIGIPSEGFGTSRDAKASFGPPEYEDAVFRLQQSGQVMRVRMRYF